MKYAVWSPPGRSAHRRLLCNVVEKEDMLTNSVVALTKLLIIVESKTKEKEVTFLRHLDWEG